MQCNLNLDNSLIHLKYKKYLIEFTVLFLIHKIFISLCHVVHVSVNIFKCFRLRIKYKFFYLVIRKILNQEIIEDFRFDDILKKIKLYALNFVTMYIYNDF